MKFVFDYEETLTRRVEIEAPNLASAIKVIYRRLDDQEIVLGAEDFIGAEIRMPLNENFLPQLQLYGDKVEGDNDFDILIDVW